MKKIDKNLSRIINTLKQLFPETLKAIVLYGSYAKGIAREDSDIDVIALFSELNDQCRDRLIKLISEFKTEHRLDLLYATVKDFENEKLPVYTSIKKEGKILYGTCNMKLSEVKPELKYREFFIQSRKLETGKIKMVEDIKKEFPSYNGIELSFIASKHAIQACLAMKGVGYSSKVDELISLCKQYFGSQIASAFSELFQIYVKSEQSTESESDRALALAKEIIKVYDIVEEKHGLKSENKLIYNY